MKYLCLDTETTCLKLHPKELNGNPFAALNTLVCVGALTASGEYFHFNIETLDNQPYGEALASLQKLVDDCDCLIGFNIKFDLHWLARYGINTRDKLVFDCQLVHFILLNQSVPYPSLNSVCEYYNLEKKLDVVSENYWKKGIDTDQIPMETLSEYLQQDVKLTYAVFLHQKEAIPDSKRRLISLQNSDLLVLMEMEKNGMLYDVETSKTQGDKIQEELNVLDQELIQLVNYPDFNVNSGDHISAVLYGGILSVPTRVSYLFTYKDGRTVTKEKWGTKELKFDQLIKPPKGSELKKEGFYATNADTLNSLRTSGISRRIVEKLLRRADIEKLRGTYLHGIPALIEKNGWETGTIHGQLNQCVAITGRLSSSKPNLQNFDKQLGYLFRSRYAGEC